jgi:hypothetical protein
MRQPLPAAKRLRLKPNAALHLHRGAEQRDAYHKRTALPGVRCKHLILIEAPCSAYHMVCGGWEN